MDDRDGIALVARRAWDHEFAQESALSADDETVGEDEAVLADEIQIDVIGAPEERVLILLCFERTRTLRDYKMHTSLRNP